MTANAPDDAPQPSASSTIVSRVRLVLAKKRAELAFEKFQHHSGPQAEYQTQELYGQSTLIEVAKIVDDPNFVNIRATIDPVKLIDLATSIDLEGLRSPIVVVETMPTGRYHVRAGFRRTLAVRRLSWTLIPAHVLPFDTPESEEYWANILENTGREKLTSCELASAAQMMRDKFGIPAASFAQKTCHSPDYVGKLLQCIDRLPPEVLHSWKRGDRVPFEIYHKLSCMTPLEAIKNLRLWMGQHRIDNAGQQAEDALRRLQARKHAPDKLLTVRGVERTQRLLMAIRMSDLSAKTKDLCQAVVEYCQGCRKRIDGIVDDHKRAPIQDLSPPSSDEVDLENLQLPIPPQTAGNEEEARRLEMEFDRLDTLDQDEYTGPRKPPREP